MVRKMLAWAMLAALAGTNVAHAQSSRWTATKATQPSATLEALTSKGRVRILVELSDFAKQGNSPGSLRVQASVAELQSSVLQAALGSSVLHSPSHMAAPAYKDIHKLRRFASVPAFAIDVSPLELERLASDPRVQSLSLDEPLEPHLDESTALIGMSHARSSPYFATGYGRTVAVLDTGVNIQHEFLGAQRFIAQACFSGAGSALNSLCPNGNVSQFGIGAAQNCALGVSGLCAHGTHVAGIAGGFNTAPSASEPHRGPAFRSKIVAVQVFSRDFIAYYSDIAASLDWLYTNRARFTPRIAAINLSLGGLTYSAACDNLYPTMTNLIERLRSAGIATVISAGNNAAVDRVAFPACISAAIAVGATTKAASGQPERIASYSNMGAMVDVLAPGGDASYPAVAVSTILSSVPGSTGYEAKKGTSMAAPHVAGAIAAIASSPGCSTKSVKQIEDALKQTGRYVTDTRMGGRFGRRRIWVPGALGLLGCASTVSLVAAE